jgi:hypothetical protein
MGAKCDKLKKKLGQGADQWGNNIAIVHLVIVQQGFGSLMITPCFA